MLTNGAVDASLFTQDNIIHAAVANTRSDEDCFHGIQNKPETSVLYSLGKELHSSKFKILNNFTLVTKGASNVEVTQLNEIESIVAFTNTGDPGSQTTCANQSALVYSSEQGTWKSTISVLGCSVSKFLVINNGPRKMNSGTNSSNEETEKLLLVTLSSGVYKKREAVIHEVWNRTNVSILQKIPTFVASDVMSVSVDGHVFLIIANEYQSSQESLQLDYSIPVTIHR